MKTYLTKLLLVPALLALPSTINLQLSTAFAQSTAFTYQGRVTDNGMNFDGPGQFQFALVTSTNVNHAATATAVAPSGGFITEVDVVAGGNGYTAAPAVTLTGGGGSGATATTTLAGDQVIGITVNHPGSGYTSAPLVIIAPPPPAISYTTYWSNDGTSSAGSEPTAVVNVPVNNGLFTVVLGDATIPNMAAIDASLFAQSDLQLRIWFNDGTHGFATLDPAQTLTPAPYAVMAESANGLPGLTVQQPQNNYGAVNLIDGSPANFVLIGVVGATIGGGGAYGDSNSVSGNFDTIAGGAQNTAGAGGGYGAATVGGGEANTASGSASTVGGGELNIASGIYSFAAGNQAQATNDGAFVWADSQDVVFNSTNNDSFNVRAEGGARFVTGGKGMTLDGHPVLTGNGVNVSLLNGIISPANLPNGLGGIGNIVSGSDATVSGGYHNNASGTNATVSGGIHNTASGRAAFVGGGGYNGYNIASGEEAVIGGGAANLASAIQATVAGGGGNQATNDYSTVPGGQYNIAGGAYSFAAGQRAKAIHDGTFVWADSLNADFSSTANDQFLIRAQGGVGINNNQPGAALDVQGNGTGIGGVSGFGEVVARFHNTASGHSAISVDASSGQDAVVYLAENGAAKWDLRHDQSDADKFNLRWQGDGQGTAMLTVATNGAATVRGSLNVDQAGLNAGYIQTNGLTFGNASGEGIGSVRTGSGPDKDGLNFYTSFNKRLTILNNGNVGVGTTSPLFPLQVAGNCAATTFVTTSDRNVKEHFQPVSAQEVLAKVAALPVSRWNFKADQTQEHIGPMAQDFHAAFNVGPDDKHITTTDEGGVALAAIQGLNEKLQNELNRQDAENAKLKQQLNQLAGMVNELNQKLNGGAQ